MYRGTRFRAVGYTAKQETVVALCQDARQICFEGIGSHHPAGPWGIPEKEDGKATEHAPMGNFGAAGLDKKLRNTRKIVVE
jgi:hypothetical protein